MSRSKSKARAKSKSKAKRKPQAKAPAQPAKVQKQPRPGLPSLLWGDNDAKANNANRLLWLRWAAVGGILLGILLSLRLWTGARPYPQLPLLPLPTMPVWLGWLVLGLFVVMLCASLFVKKPQRWMWGALCVGALMMLLDQSRIQPWFYYYLSIFFACAWASGGEDERAEMALHACRIMVIGVYVWAGLQKMNATFIGNIGPWMFRPVTTLLPASFAQGFMFKALLYSVPLVELGIGVGLLFRRTRVLAIGMATGMHAVILLLIGPLGHNWNSVVWPWNIVMSVFTFALFWRTDALTLKQLRPKAKLTWLYAFLFLCGPLLNKADLWDNYLSAKLYAGNTSTAYLVFPADKVAKLPPTIRKYVKNRTISIENWSLADMNVPAYPEKRVYRAILRHMCTKVECAWVRLVIKGKPHWKTGKNLLSVYQLNPKTGALHLLKKQLVKGAKL